MDTPLPPRTEPLPLRILRIALLAVLSLAGALLIALVLACLSPALQGAIADLLGVPFNAHPFRGVGAVTLAAIRLGPIVLMAAGLLFLAWALRQTSWSRVAAGFVLLVGVLAYLGHDEPAFTRPVRFQDPSEATPEARESFAAFMRYGRQQPLGKEFKEPAFTEPYPRWSPDDAAKWRSTVTAHRADFAAHAASLAPALAWWRDLDRFSRIGDLTAPDPHSDIPAFQVLRSLSQHAIATASLQAIDGHGDQAIDTVLPLITVSLKLQPDSRTLVRPMIAIVIERLALQTAGFILDTTPVSPAARARLLDAVKGSDPVPGARSLMERDYAFSLLAVAPKPAGEIFMYDDSLERHPWLRDLLNAASPVLYNPHATFNAYGRLVGDLQDEAAVRDFAGMEKRFATFVSVDTAPRPKNFMGLLLIRSMVPATVKVAENYWRAQDLRAALAKRLEQPQRPPPA